MSWSEKNLDDDGEERNVSVTDGSLVKYSAAEAAKNQRQQGEDSGHGARSREVAQLHGDVGASRQGGTFGRRQQEKIPRDASQEAILRNRKRELKNRRAWHERRKLDKPFTGEQVCSLMLIQASVYFFTIEGALRRYKR